MAEKNYTSTNDVVDEYAQWYGPGYADGDYDASNRRQRARGDNWTVGVVVTQVVAKSAE